jgi:hypothetical protein
MAASVDQGSIHLSAGFLGQFRRVGAEPVGDRGRGGSGEISKMAEFLFLQSEGPTNHLASSLRIARTSKLASRFVHLLLRFVALGLDRCRRSLARSLVSIHVLVARS